MSHKTYPAAKGMPSSKPSSSQIVRGILSSRQGKPNQMYLNKVGSTKFSAPEHELDTEKFLDKITPRSHVMQKHVKTFIEGQKDRVAYTYGATDRDLALAKLVAWEMWQVQLLQDSLEKETEKSFTKEFYAWLKGCGLEEDHQKTPWGRQKVIDAECKEYVSSFVDAKLDFMAKIQAIVAKANVTNLQGVGEHYLYFKYVVRGGWEDRDSAEFMNDYNTLMCCNSKAVMKAQSWIYEDPKQHSWKKVMERKDMKGLKDAYEDVMMPQKDTPARETCDALNNTQTQKMGLDYYDGREENREPLVYKLVRGYGGGNPPDANNMNADYPDSDSDGTDEDSDNNGKGKENEKTRKIAEKEGRKAANEAVAKAVESMKLSAGGRLDKGEVSNMISELNKTLGEQFRQQSEQNKSVMVSTLVSFQQEMQNMASQLDARQKEIAADTKALGKGLMKLTEAFKLGEGTGSKKVMDVINGLSNTITGKMAESEGRVFARVETIGKTMSANTEFLKSQTSDLNRFSGAVGSKFQEILGRFEGLEKGEGENAVTTTTTTKDDRVDSLLKEVEDLKHSIHLGSQNITQQQQELDKTKEVNKELQTKLVFNMNELGSAREVLDKMGKELMSTRKKLEKAQKDVGVLREYGNAAATSLERVGSELEGTRNELRSSQERLQREQYERASSEARSSETIRNMELELNNSRHQLARVEARAAKGQDVERTLAATKAMIARQEAELEKHRATVGQLEQEKSSLMQTLQQMHAVGVKVTQERDQYLKQSKELLGSSKIWEEKFLQLARDKASVEQQKEMAFQREGELEALLRNVSSDLEEEKKEAKEHWESFVKQHNEFQEFIDKANEVVYKGNQKLNAQKEKIKLLKASIYNEKIAKASFSQQIDQLKEALENKDVDLYFVGEDFDDVRATNDRLKGEAQVLRDTLQTVMQHKDQTIKDMQTQLAELKKKK